MDESDRRSAIDKLVQDLKRKLVSDEAFNPSRAGKLELTLYSGGITKVEYQTSLK